MVLKQHSDCGNGYCRNFVWVLSRSICICEAQVCRKQNSVHHSSGHDDDTLSGNFNTNVLLMRNLGWVNTFKPMIIPSFAGSAFGIFLLRQFIMQMPQDLFDAARIDGANEGFIFLKIILPLLKPAMATLGLFTFIGSWNDLINPLIYLYDIEKYTLPLGLTFFQTQYAGFWHYLMAGSVISIVPIIIVFFFTQNYFVEGIKLSGLKG